MRDAKCRGVIPSRWNLDAISKVPPMFLVVTLMIAEFALGLRRGDPEFTSFDWKSKDLESDDDDIYLSMYL